MNAIITSVIRCKSGHHFGKLLPEAKFKFHILKPFTLIVTSSAIDKIFEIFGPIFEQNVTLNFEPIFEHNANFGPIFEKSAYFGPIFEKSVNFEHFVNGK